MSCAEGVKGEDISGKAFLEIGALLFVFFRFAKLHSTVVLRQFKVFASKKKERRGLVVFALLVE